MFRSSRRSLLLLGALLVVAIPLAARSLEAKDEVPFKGKAMSEFRGEDFSNPPFLTTYFEIVSGNCTHMGKITGEAEVHWYVLSLEPLIAIPLSASITLVAANGDELYLTHSPGSWDPDIQGSVAEYTITGGTGRFEGASGSGDATATGSGDVALTWKGTIDYKKN